MKTAEIPWLAGLMEGESSFGVYYTKGYPVFSVQTNMTDEDVVLHAAEVAGVGTVIGPRVNKSAPDHWKPWWSWKISTRDHAYAVLVAIYPFMGERRQAKIKEFVDAYLMTPGKFHLPPHGTRGRYEKGCRCASCRSVHNARMRECRARRKAMKSGDHP